MSEDLEILNGDELIDIEEPDEENIKSKLDSIEHKIDCMYEDLLKLSAFLRSKDIKQEQIIDEQIQVKNQKIKIDGLDQVLRGFKSVYKEL